MTYFHVALLQLISGNSLQDNLTKGIEACKKAKAMGADLALFPEMWSTGYTMSNLEQMKAASIGSDSDFLHTFRDLAKELDMAIAITYLESFDPTPRNTVTLFDRFGNNILTYAKVHTCDFGIEHNLTPGDDFYVTNLNTHAGEIKIGAMICYDREFPESARILMLKGAEIILVPNSCPMEINRLSQLRARSYENMVGIATTNYANGQTDCNGHSSAFDGISYMPELPCMTQSRDMLILETGEAEGIYIASFPIDALRTFRENEIEGNAYRHPTKYHLLVSEEINYPFHRKDYRA